MCIAARLVDAAGQLRLMARYYSDDANEIHLITHWAVLWLLRRERAENLTVSQADLAAALCAAAHQLAAEQQREARSLRSFGVTPGAAAFAQGPRAG
jgi:hypothetical protein